MAFSSCVCPNCKNPVTHVRQTVGARRSRVCQKCGHPFVTYEVSDQEYRFLRSTIDMVRDKACSWRDKRAKGA